MCGRYTLTNPESALAEALAEPPEGPLEARFNIAPTEPILAVRRGKSRAREAVWLRWGLIPPSSSSPDTGARLINARSETVATKPVFRNSFSKRRCLVLADGFFEWKRMGAGKQPFYFRRADGGPMAFAGIWTRWRGAAEPIDSCSILTTDANELVSEIHDRMPAILAASQHRDWLETPEERAETLLELLRPFPAGRMESYPVDRAVNRAGREGEELVARAEPLAENLSLF